MSIYMIVVNMKRVLPFDISDVSLFIHKSTNTGVASMAVNKYNTCTQETSRTLVLARRFRPRISIYL
jgi:hypothetical protein